MVTRVNWQVVQDLMIFKHHVKCHENRMKNERDRDTRLNTRNNAKIHKNHLSGTNVGNTGKLVS